MRKTYNIIVILLALLLSFVSCEKWQAPELQAPEYTGKKANKTIADIKSRHTLLNQNVQDSICSYSGEKFIVKAVVVSSDEGGNCYKYITVQDKTGGIEIAIDQNSLFNEYPVGQIVYINCDGLVVGDYRNKYQIGWVYENSIGRINYMMLGKYLSKDGLPSMDNINELSPFGGICEINSAADISSEADPSDIRINCLCTIKKARFSSSCHGLQLATDDASCDRALENFPIIVRTSNYAKFRNIIIDATKEYDLTGILTIYKKQYQFTLRTAEDVKVAGQEPQEPQQTEVLVQKLSFDANSFTSGGWTQTTEGAWNYQSSGSFMIHNPDAMCDDWLISPEITINQEDCYLKVEHWLRDNLSPDFYQIYYSTTYQEGTAINPDDWHPYTVTVYPSNNFAPSNPLTPVPQGSFRIAIRYNKQNITAVGHDAWAIKTLNFYRTEWR
ncbi:MAG: OB-fold nucleic acid binding domain-containing protein [Bacteroidales bacterium]|nr:OB-fold nucleic acid binding domain-containing protein [Bacteroidales bacterium]